MLSYILFCTATTHLLFARAVIIGNGRCKSWQCEPLSERTTILFRQPYNRTIRELSGAYRALKYIITLCFPARSAALIPSCWTYDFFVLSHSVSLTSLLLTLVLRPSCYTLFVCLQFSACLAVAAAVPPSKYIRTVIHSVCPAIEYNLPSRRGRRKRLRTKQKRQTNKPQFNFMIVRKKSRHIHDVHDEWAKQRGSFTVTVNNPRDCPLTRVNAGQSCIQAIK